MRLSLLQDVGQFLHLWGRYAAVWASQVTQWSRIHLPVQKMQEIRLQSRGREDLLQEEMAAHSSILAWEIPWAEEPGGLQSMGSQSRTQLSSCAHTQPEVQRQT